MKKYHVLFRYFLWQFLIEIDDFYGSATVKNLDLLYSVASQIEDFVVGDLTLLNVS